MAGHSTSTEGTANVHDVNRQTSVSVQTMLTLPCTLPAACGAYSAWQEGYYIFREMARTSAEAADDEKKDDARPLKGPNQWPSEELLPRWVTKPSSL